MTATEFNAARSILGLTDEAIAADYNVTPAVVRAWASGEVRVPKRIAQMLAFYAAAAEREAAMRANGLPACTWHDRRPNLSDLDANAIQRESDMVTAHIATCELCKARIRFEEENFGPMPLMPMPGWVKLFAWVERVPPWARPAVVGAALLGAMVLIRVVFVIPFVVRDPGRLGEALIALVAAASAGAVGGLTYSATRPTLKKLGLAGAYLTGIVCVIAYMGALALASPYAFGKSLVESRSDLVIFGIVSVFFGLFIGHSWFRDEKLQR